MRCWIVSCSLLLGACSSAPRFVPAISQRALTLPKGVQEVGLHTSAVQGFLDFGFWNRENTGMSYRYGLTDNIELSYPPQVAVRVRNGDVQAMLKASLVGLETYSYGPREPPPDPRLNWSFGRSIKASLEATAQSRVRLADTRSLELSFTYGLDAYIDQGQGHRWHAQSGLTQEITEYLSAGLQLGVGTRYTTDLWTVSCPLAFHLGRFVDLVLLARYQREFIGPVVTYRSNGFTSGYGGLENMRSITMEVSIRYE